VTVNPGTGNPVVKVLSRLLPGPSVRGFVSRPDGHDLQLIGEWVERLPEAVHRLVGDRRYAAGARTVAREIAALLEVAALSEVRRSVDVLHHLTREGLAPSGSAFP